MTLREQAVRIASLPRAALIDYLEMMLHHLHLAGKFKPVKKILETKP